MEVAKYVSLLTEIIHIIVGIKWKVLRRWVLWYDFYSLNIDTLKASSEILEKDLEGAMKHAENLKIFRYILGSDVGFVLLHLLSY